MSVEREAVISNESGIHARVAAMIVQLARELSEKYHTKLYLRGTRGERFLMRSIMKLIALKTRRGDAVFVTAEGGDEQRAAEEMAAFLEGDLEMHEPQELHEVDKLLHENALMQERLQMILEAVQDGICVVDKSGIITYVNPSYLRIVHKTMEMVLGQNVFTHAPHGNRVGVLRSGVARIGVISHKKNGTTVVANVNPIFIDGEIAGVVSVIKDITEIQNLMERLTQVSARAEYLEQELLRTKKTASAFGSYIGKSGKVVDVLALASKAAASSATVLIRGESGTGKEVIAEGIHYASSRRRGPFIRVNCGAIPPALLESELFGHEKGAFTGAVKRKLGKFELANHGTIFLDEIAEMDKNMQVKLLRVLQQKEFDRVGGEETVHVDVRIIAACDSDLKRLTERGLFSKALYDIISKSVIRVPSLRSRREDIPELARHIVSELAEQHQMESKTLADETIGVLEKYDWPGNIKQLQSVLEYAFFNTKAPVIAPGDISLMGDVKPDNKWKEDKDVFVKAWQAAGGNVSRLANLLNVSRVTLYRYLKKYHLEKK